MFDSIQINYQQKRYWKVFLLGMAIFIALITLLYTNILVKRLSAEQKKMVTLLADAYKQLNMDQMMDQTGDISLLFTIIKSNTNIPVILADSNDHVLEWRNLDSAKVRKKAGYLKRELEIMKSQHQPVVINFMVKNKLFIYYRDSKLLSQLKIYPYIQLILVILFIIIAYFAFDSSQKYQQNKLWTGLSKETAHQLGTPVSSLMALSENIKNEEGKIPESLLIELDKDIQRLATITDRFSKIGSIPKFETRNIYEMIYQTVSYMRPRISNKIVIEITDSSAKDVDAMVIPSLFDWVIENLIKNAVNAMEGKGKITFCISRRHQEVMIDIMDTGKGIPRNKFNTIFEPGYTTSKRGWGLGLTLCRRIIENYHKGEIYVKNSEVGKGTTFRIKLTCK